MCGTLREKCAVLCQLGGALAAACVLTSDLSCLSQRAIIIHHSWSDRAVSEKLFRWYWCMCRVLWPHGGTGGGVRSHGQHADIEPPWPIQAETILIAQRALPRDCLSSGLPLRAALGKQLAVFCLAVFGCLAVFPYMLHGARNERVETTQERARRVDAHADAVAGKVTCGCRWTESFVACMMPASSVVVAVLPHADSF